jgi:hypothetical protein
MRDASPLCHAVERRANKCPGELRQQRSPGHFVEEVEVNDSVCVNVGKLGFLLMDHSELTGHVNCARRDRKTDIEFQSGRRAAASIF